MISKDKFNCLKPTECPNCKDAKVLRNMFCFEETDVITWHVWKKDADGKLCKMVMEGTTELPVFLKHCYVKRSQASSYQMERESVRSEDFDQNL